MKHGRKVVLIVIINLKTKIDKLLNKNILTNSYNNYYLTYV